LQNRIKRNDRSLIGREGSTENKAELVGAPPEVCSINRSWEGEAILGNEGVFSYCTKSRWEKLRLVPADMHSADRGIAHVAQEDQPIR